MLLLSHIPFTLPDFMLVHPAQEGLSSRNPEAVSVQKTQRAPAFCSTM